MPARLVVRESYDRARARARISSALRKYFPPHPSERPTDVIDVIESALKDVMPAFHVRVTVEKITANGGPH